MEKSAFIFCDWISTFLSHDKSIVHEEFCMQQNFDKADNLAKGNHWIQKNLKLCIFLWQNATLNEKNL